MSYLFLVLVLSLPGLDADRPPRQPKTPPTAPAAAQALGGALASGAPVMLGD